MLKGKKSKEVESKWVNLKEFLIYCGALENCQKPNKYVTQIKAPESGENVLLLFVFFFTKL